MTDRISVHRTTENAETVRKARELAWVASLMILLSPTGYIFALAIEKTPLDMFEGAMFFVIPVVVLIRLIVVATQLGRNLQDHDFLATMKSWPNPPAYLAARVFGLVKGAE